MHAKHNEPGELKLFFASDLHGSERCFRKFLSAARLYGANALFLGGDLIGKELVLLRKRASGQFEGRVGTKMIRLATEAELRQFHQDCADCGSYVAELSEDGLPTPAELADVMDRLAQQRLESWMERAREKLAVSNIPLVVIPGNDDPPFVDAVLSRDGLVNADQRLVDVKGFQVAGLGWSTPTPWLTHREYPDEVIAAKLDELLCTADPNLPLILDVHVPPYASGLDDCPDLDAELRPRFGSGGVLSGPVGSRAVVEAIQRYRPVLGLFGHVHEARGSTQLGSTLCVNPGSDFTQGRLLGCLAILRGNCVVNWILTEG
jgi:uncharacterized protein